MTNTVYVVHCIDTEGPLAESLDATFSRLKEIFDIELEATEENLSKLQRGELDLGGKEADVAKVFSPALLGYHRNWDSIDAMLDRIMATEFRQQFPDSRGNGWLYNWHCLDHYGFENNPRQRDMQPHAVFDHYRNRPDLSDDGIYFHHHPVGFLHEAHRPATNYLSYKPYIFEILARKVIERQWFPSVYRPGFHTTRPDSHWFLEQYIPFEYANQALVDENEGERQNDIADGRFGDWRRASTSWTPYHPSHDDYQLAGNCRRWIGRCLNVGTRLRLLNENDVEQAFQEAASGAPVILSFTNHDFRVIDSDIEYVHTMLKQACEQVDAVNFVYANSRDAMRHALSLEPEQQLSMKVSIDGERLHVESESEIFGPQPFLALETLDGRFLHDNFDFDLPFRKWHYTFDDNTLPLDRLRSVGVAANDKYGSTTVINIDVESRSTRQYRN